MIGERKFEFLFNDGRVLTARGTDMTMAFAQIAPKIGARAAQKLVSHRDITPKRKRTRIRLREKTVAV